jgi:hypothetical protein
MVLRGNRPRQLKETDCATVAPGVESWTDYSNKAGVGHVHRARTASFCTDIASFHHIL